MVSYTTKVVYKDLRHFLPTSTVSPIYRYLKIAASCIDTAAVGPISLCKLIGEAQIVVKMDNTGIDQDS